MLQPFIYYEWEFVFCRLRQEAKKVKGFFGDGISWQRGRARDMLHPRPDLDPRQNEPARFMRFEPERLRYSVNACFFRQMLSGWRWRNWRQIPSSSSAL